jgi:hypothetical protein
VVEQLCDRSFCTFKTTYFQIFESQQKSAICLDRLYSPKTAFLRFELPPRTLSRRTSYTSGAAYKPRPRRALVTGASSVCDTHTFP